MTKDGLELFWRRVRRATRRTNRAVTGELRFALVLALVTGFVAAFVPSTNAAQKLGIAFGPVAFLSVIVLLWHWWRYRRASGYRHEDWVAEHSDDLPEILWLYLRSRTKVPAPLSDFAPNECRVRIDRGEWLVIPDGKLGVERFERLWFRIDGAANLSPGKVYEVRWYGTDRRRLTEITRETFRLNVHHQTADRQPVATWDSGPITQDVR